MTGPATASRRLRTILRMIRLDAGLSDAAVAQDLCWPPGRLPAIESGKAGITLGCLRSLLAHYRITNPDRINQLVLLQKLARGPHWADTFRQFYSRPFLDFLRHETDARQILCFHPRAVPGLLQTEAYARAIIQATAPHPVSRRDTEARVKARMRRQHAVFTTDRHVQVALTELALLRPVTADNAVMRTQFDHLAALVERPRVDLTLLPADCDTHTGVGPFVVLMYHSPPDPDLVYRDDAPTATALDDAPSTVERYQMAFSDLRAHGTSGQEMATRLTTIWDDIR